MTFTNKLISRYDEFAFYCYDKAICLNTAWEERVAWFTLPGHSPFLREVRRNHGGMLFAGLHSCLLSSLPYRILAHLPHDAYSGLGPTTSVMETVFPNMLMFHSDLGGSSLR